MTALSTAIRAAHLVSNAAWFGGSLMGAVGLNSAASVPVSPARQTQIADAGWRRWGPVQGAAIGVHLASGLAIILDNRTRVVVHPATTGAVVAKTVLTGAALAATVAAWQSGRRSGDRREGVDSATSSDGRRLAWLQWATPATTGGLLVLDAYLGEQQRGVAGLLDRAIG